MIDEPVDVDQMLKKDTGSPLKKLSLHIRRKKLRRAEIEEEETHQGEEQVRHMDEEAARQSEQTAEEDSGPDPS